MCDTSDRRRNDLQLFYRILRQIKQANGECRLANYDANEVPESPGVYFFKETQEYRIDTARGQQRRIVRVGKSSNLRKRLRAHKNNKGASAFRDVVRIAQTQRDGLIWNSLKEENKENYRKLTSQIVREMPFERRL